MGLATAYGIVKQHGGFIHVYREPGQGTLFRVYLPAQEGMAAEGSSAKAPAPALSEMRGSETILIAEDHESIREMTRQILLNLGYRVLSACDGEEALKLCEKESPALAILDVVMPKLGGAAVASKLSALFRGPARSFHQRLFAGFGKHSTCHGQSALPAKTLQPDHTRPHGAGDS